MVMKDDGQAMGYLQRATALDPGNYLAHFYYASLIHDQQTPSEADWTTIRSELQKTIELAPQFVEATEMLASINLTRNADIPETVDLLIKALSVSPGRDYLILQLSYALSRTERRDNARVLVRNLLAKTTLDLAIRQSAENLLDFLDRTAGRATINGALAGRTTNRTEPIPNDDATVPPEVRRSRATPEADDAEPVRIARREAAPLPPGTERVAGVLTLLDCKDGLTLSLVLNGKTVKLHSTNPGAIKFTSFNPAVVSQIVCGPMPRNGVPAAIVYRPKNGNGDIGDPLSVDFLDDEVPQAAAPASIPGTTSVKGQLTMLECSTGVTMSVISEGKTLFFRADSTSEVAFLNGPNPDGTVDCGPLPRGGLPVSVLYRPLKTEGIEGEPVIVQFQKGTTSR